MRTKENMFRSWKLGQAFGISIYIHWTFLLLVGFVLLSNWDRSGPHSALYAVAVLLGVFGCVVLHELGHALMAKRFDIPTRDITLYPIGGVARLERMSERPSEEFCIAIAGPAVNVAIAGLLFAILAFIGLPLDDSAGLAAFLKGNYLFTLAVTNIGLVVFNLIPAFPMDGGRVLRSVLVPLLGRLPATEVAANVGAAFAFLLMFAGFWKPMFLLVGGFVFLAGRYELWAVRRQDHARQMEPLDVIPATNDILDAMPALDPSQLSRPCWDTKTRVWVVVRR
jgi:Zn-dependent protease